MVVNLKQILGLSVCVVKNINPITRHLLDTTIRHVNNTGAKYGCHFSSGLNLVKDTFKNTFADNLLSPMSSKISTSFFLQSKRN